MGKNECVWAVLSQSRELDEYDAICRTAAELGARYVACGGLAETTASQWDDPDDSYCRYFANSPSVFKFAEAAPVAGVYPAEHVAANAELLRRKSQVLADHGLKGIWNGLEPMWLPESFYERQPHLRGPRVDHPARSLHDRFAPCTDRPEVLEAYAQAVHRICQIAPALEIFEFYTNDAGAGFCWCEYLYPGQNGPEHCRRRAMGQRVGGLLSAFVEGGRRAGRDVTVLLRPKHFSPPETEDLLARLPEGAGMNYRIFPTQFHTPFMLGYCLRPEWLEALRGRRRRVFVHFPGQGADQGVRGGVPCPFLLLETLAEYRRHRIDGITLLNPTGMHWVNRAVLKAHPAGLPTEHRRLAAVEALAAERFGGDLAEAVGSFYRDVDAAVRIWPCYTNGLLFALSLVERRALLEPLLHRRQDVPVGPGAAWHAGQVHLGPDSERTNLFWDGSITPPGSWRALSYLEPDFRLALNHLDRAIEDLSGAAGGSPPPELAEELERAECFRCLLATLSHKLQTQQLWERIADLESRPRAEGAEVLAGARRALTATIRRECDNTRRLIELLAARPELLQWGELEEAVSRAGGGLVERLGEKLRLMQDDLARSPAAV